MNSPCRGHDGDDDMDMKPLRGGGGADGRDLERGGTTEAARSRATNIPTASVSKTNDGLKYQGRHILDQVEAKF